MRCCGGMRPPRFCRLRTSARAPAGRRRGEPPAQARLVRLDEPRPLAVAVVVTARYDAVDDA
jgi:hypothetical protein